MSPRLDADLMALVDQEGAYVRDFLDAEGCHIDAMRPTAKRVARLALLDCLAVASDPLKLLARMLAWDRLLTEGDE